MLHVKLLDPLCYLQAMAMYASLQHDINGMYKIYHPVRGEQPSLLCSFLSFLLPEMLARYLKVQPQFCYHEDDSCKPAVMGWENGKSQ